jgi:hypothetical protein
MQSKKQKVNQTRELVMKMTHVHSKRRMSGQRSGGRGRGWRREGTFAFL